MSRAKVVVVHGSEFEALYVNGAMVVQDTRIYIEDALGAVKNLGPFDIVTHQVSQDWLKEVGYFPDDLGDVTFLDPMIDYEPLGFRQEGDEEEVPGTFEVVFEFNDDASILETMKAWKERADIRHEGIEIPTREESYFPDDMEMDVR